MTNTTSNMVSLHGTFLSVFGCGVLITGEAGIGKSECALDLISKQHKLVADDLVRFEWDDETNSVHGKASSKAPYHMHIKSLGLIDIQSIFGSRCVKPTQQLDLVLHLVKELKPEDFATLEAKNLKKSVLDKEIPFIEIPATRQRHIALLVEVAVKNLKLKNEGHNTADSFIAEHHEILAQKIKYAS